MAPRSTASPRWWYIALLWAAACPAAYAQAYAGAAIGNARFSVDCGGVPTCDRSDGGGKVFVGWRSGTAWGVEAMVADFGRASLANGAASASYRKLAVGVAATGLWRQGGWLAEGRVGVATSRVTHQPFGGSAASRSSLSGWLGASVGRELTPALALRLDIDGVKGKTAAGDNGDAGLVSVALAAKF